MNVTYNASQNTDESAFPGVPLADMTEAEFKALPLWVQVSVAASPMYSVPVALRPVLAADPGSEIPPPDKAGKTTDEVTNDV